MDQENIPMSPQAAIEVIERLRRALHGGAPFPPEEYDILDGAIQVLSQVVGNEQPQPAMQPRTNPDVSQETRDGNTTIKRHGKRLDNGEAN
jgi:hypothetical protein